MWKTKYRYPDKCMYISDDNLIESVVNNAIQSPQFEKWNNDTLNHIYQVAFGVNGEKAARLALILLNTYIVWLKSRPLDTITHPIEDIETSYLNLQQLVCKFNRTNMFNKEHQLNATISGEIYKYVVNPYPFSTKSFSCIVS
jgi:mRNA degradation ribonuclease J1/J2